jgi:hypothetical protein
MKCFSTQLVVHKIHFGTFPSMFFGSCGPVSNHSLNTGPVFGLGPFNIDIYMFISGCEISNNFFFICVFVRQLGFLVP